MLKPREFRARLTRRAARIGLTIPPAISDSLETYLELLLRWSQKINLTALSYQDRPDETVDRLLIEPLAAARLVSLPRGRLVDVGSGGGSPAIPLRLALGGDIQLTLIESKARKAAFLREALRQLQIDGSVESARLEELCDRPGLRESAEAVSVRAVRIDPRALANIRSLLKFNGIALLFRSEGKDEPRTSGLRVEAMHPLVDTAGSRLIILRKQTANGRTSSIRETEAFHVEH